MSDEWVYVLDPEGWFELKDCFVAGFPSHKAAANHCDLSFHTFRRIGKASPWVPRRLFDAMLDEMGGERLKFNHLFLFFTNEEKESFYHKLALIKKIEKYGKDFFSGLGRRKWENTPEREKTVHCLKARLKNMGDKGIEEIVDELSTKLHIDSGLLRHGFDIYRYGHNGARYECFPSEEADALRNFKNGVFIPEKESPYMRTILYRLCEKGVITMKREGTYDFSYWLNEDGLRRWVHLFYAEELNKLKKLRDGIEEGYFFCDKDETVLPSSDAMTGNYRCPSCDSGLNWEKDEKLLTDLDVFISILEKVI